MLLGNGALGLMLVILALGLFWNCEWLSGRLRVSLSQSSRSLFLLPAMDASINMISLFGFIVTLGICRG